MCRSRLGSIQLSVSGFVSCVVPSTLGVDVCGVVIGVCLRCKPNPLRNRHIALRHTRHHSQYYTCHPHVQQLQYTQHCMHSWLRRCCLPASSYAPDK